MHRTFRQIDVAYVLEGVAGVLDVYAVTPRAERRPVASVDPRDRYSHLPRLALPEVPEDEFAFAVRIVHDTGVLAAMHYQLLRVLTHEECATVCVFTEGEPPTMRERFARIVLSADERAAARARVPLVTPALQQEAAPSPWRRRAFASVLEDFRVLIADRDPDMPKLTKEAFGDASRVFVESVQSAIDAMLAKSFDVVLCHGGFAFTERGLLHRLRALDEVIANDVVVLVSHGTLPRALDDLRTKGFRNRVLEKPILSSDLARLALWLHTPFTIPVHTPRASLKQATEPPKARPGARPQPKPSPSPPRVAASTMRIVIVDDDPYTARLADPSPDSGAAAIVVTSDVWEALELVADPKTSLVACSATLRGPSGPLYRALWNARPELKARFFLIADAKEAPPSSQERRHLLMRPLNAGALRGLLASFGSGVGDGSD